MTDQALPPFFYEIFDRSLPRLGPGDEASTVKALEMLGLLGAMAPQRTLRLLDVGCGTGAQTIELAKHLRATIVALDNYPPFLEELQSRAKAAGVADTIEVRLGDMRDVPSWAERFDVVWAEGSLYVMGFKEGLEACAQVLEPGGLFAASELTWLSPQPPAECRDFFDAEYPAMTDVATNLEIIAAAGYQVVGHFVEPDVAWTVPYYDPLGKRVAEFRERYAGDAEKLEMLDWVDAEIETFRKYSQYYGNVFYLMRRR